MYEMPCRTTLESKARGNLAGLQRSLEKTRVDSRRQVMASQGGFGVRQVLKHAPHPVVNPRRVRYEPGALRIGLQRLQPPTSLQQRPPFPDELAYLVANCVAD